MEAYYTMPSPPYTMKYTVEKNGTTRLFLATNGSKWELANQIMTEVSLTL